MFFIERHGMQKNDSKYILMKSNTDALWASYQFLSLKHFGEVKDLELKFEDVFYIQISI